MKDLGDGFGEKSNNLIDEKGGPSRTGRVQNLTKRKRRVKGRASAMVFHWTGERSSQILSLKLSNIDVRCLGFSFQQIFCTRCSRDFGFRRKAIIHISLHSYVM